MPSTPTEPTSADPAGPPDAAPRTEALEVPRWVRTLVVWMDEAIGIPGTRIRFGLDAVLGLLLPGAGDALTATSHLALLWVAFRARVPGVVMARMVLNVAFDALTGAVPILGDAFDVAFKANRKNLQLLERNRGRAQERARASDYLVVFGAMLAVCLVLILPLILTGVLVGLLLD